MINNEATAFSSSPLDHTYPAPLMSSKNHCLTCLLGPFPTGHRLSLRIVCQVLLTFGVNLLPRARAKEDLDARCSVERCVPTAKRKLIHVQRRLIFSLIVLICFSGFSSW